jgi:hypothetical protein
MTLIFIVIAFAVGVWAGYATKPTPTDARLDAAKRVKAAFDGVDWSVQSFTSSGVMMSTTDGHTHFYKAKEIDAAIKRLNVILTDLSK